MDNGLVTKLIDSGLSKEILQTYMQFLIDNDLAIDCQLTYNILLNPSTNIDHICLNQISKHVIQTFFKEFQEWILAILNTPTEVNNISMESKAIINQIGEIVILCKTIAEDQYYLTALAMESLDFISTLNQTCKKTNIPNLTNVNTDVKDMFIEILENIKLFKDSIYKLPALEQDYTNTLGTCLQTIILILQLDYTTLELFKRLAGQIVIAKENEFTICFNCETCEKKDTCPHKINHKMN